MRKRIIVFLLLCLSALAMQSLGEAASGKGAQSGEGVVPVALGQSVVGLTGPWKFHIGDDPRWADPGFDDSAWQSYVLMPRRSPLAPEEVTQSAALPGWQQQDIPGTPDMPGIRPPASSRECRLSGAVDAAACG